MASPGCQFQTFEELSQYVNQTLCRKDQLKVGAFRLSARMLRRGRRPCGVYFCLHGPRQLKNIAIWETDQNSILFYCSSGERFGRIRLSAAPKLDDVMLRAA